MSIESEITRITDNVASAYSEAEALGADVPSEANSDNLPGTLAAIPRATIVQETGSGTNNVMSQAAVTEAIRKTAVFYIEGNSTTAGTWTGTCDDITEYYDGLMIHYKLNVAGVSGGSTLNINGLGAVAVKRNATTAVTTTYAVGSVLNLTYTTTNGTPYWVIADYDANTKTSAGTSNKTAAKMFLVGATSQNSSGVTTYSNKNCYIGTDDCLYSNGEKVNTLTEDEINSLIDTKITEREEENSTTTETVLSDNLFDKSTAVTGKHFYHSSSGPTFLDNVTAFYAYVPLRGAGTYRTVIWMTLHGTSYAKRVPVLKEDNSFLQNVTGTLTDIDGTFSYLEFTITEEMINNGAAIYAYDGMHNGTPYNLNNLMIVKDRDYPTEYIPYGYIEITTEVSKPVNILSGKTAVFLGDSICAGTTTLADAPEYGYGWAGLIGEANSMKWGNYGRNGGTVTPISSVDEARWLPTQVDKALAAHPTADYVIFEGGCNDADILGTSGLGSLSTSGYAPSDDSDFTSAFETLVLKILNSYPNAKIGYIVAHKMGTSGDYSSANNRYRKFFDRAIEICEKWGIPYLDLWKSNPLNPKLSIYYDSSLSADQANEQGKSYTDGQHLTLTGYNKIAPQIEAFMRSL